MKNVECVAFGAAVRRLRARLDLSQEQFADRVKIHRTYIGGIERGERNPTLTMIARIAAGLDVSASQLLSEAEKE
ncbi:MAG: helix-turn-helix transcriptional regulator [Acidobacteria bacterium]|nr:helix-turn-helix transcriptional regulator [Acidobacteriota bacterium]